MRGPYTREEWAKLKDTPWSKECRKGWAIINGRWFDNLILEYMANETRRSIRHS